eukprot:3688886-Amphidinium_carterae.1
MPVLQATPHDEAQSCGPPPRCQRVMRSKLPGLTRLDKESNSAGGPVHVTSYRTLQSGLHLRYVWVAVWHRLRRCHFLHVSRAIRSNDRARGVMTHHATAPDFSSNLTSPNEHSISLKRHDSQ